jgi:hypothetical protein
MPWLGLIAPAGIHAQYGTPYHSAGAVAIAPAELQ